MIRVTTTAFDDQKPGTSGLRKTTQHFQQTHYLENFVQSIFNAMPKPSTMDKVSLVLGGDGRFYNKTAIQIIIRMAAANGISRLIIGQDGILSTPAASLLIRNYKTDGGIILSASHNPGGQNGDFGIKFNSSNGGPAAEQITNEIYQQSLNITEYFTIDHDEQDIHTLGETTLNGMTIEIIDSVSAYSTLMSQLFDFSQIKQAVAHQNLSLCFDAMHAVTGPYANEIFVNQLGFDKDLIINAIPLEDFGGDHPDPNQAHAKLLVDKMYSESGTTLGAASDGDGDRNMILGKGFFVTPSDSLAVMAANINSIKGYTSGIAGVARSMPTSRAVDKVAQANNFPHYETPTGWKFFGNLLDANKITLCGEESFGTGSNHIREKDGIWAVLFWLNLIAIKNQSVEEIVKNHWEKYGRHYYARHDYEEIDSTIAQNLFESLKELLPSLNGKVMHGQKITKTTDFSYLDPVDNSLSENQGLIIQLEPDARIIYRLSGTGTKGATLRIYLEYFETDKNNLNNDTTEMLNGLAQIAIEVANIESLTGRTSPDVIT